MEGGRGVGQMNCAILQAISRGIDRARLEAIHAFRLVPVLRCLSIRPAVANFDIMFDCRQALFIVRCRESEKPDRAGYLVHPPAPLGCQVTLRLPPYITL